jgi:hypothetical protein
VSLVGRGCTGTPRNEWAFRRLAWHPARHPLALCLNARSHDSQNVNAVSTCFIDARTEQSTGVLWVSAIVDQTRLSGSAAPESLAPSVVRWNGFWCEQCLDGAGCDRASFKRPRGDRTLSTVTSPRRPASVRSERSPSLIAIVERRLHLHGVVNSGGAIPPQQDWSDHQRRRGR